MRIGQRRKQNYVFQVNRDWNQKHPLWRLWIAPSWSKRSWLKVSWWPHEPNRLTLIVFGRSIFG